MNKQHLLIGKGEERCVNRHRCCPNRAARTTGRPARSGGGGGGGTTTTDPRSASGETGAGLCRRAVNPRLTLDGKAGLRRAPEPPPAEATPTPERRPRCHRLGPSVTVKCVGSEGGGRRGRGGGAIPSPRVRGGAARARAAAVAPRSTQSPARGRAPAERRHGGARSQPPPARPPAAAPPPGAAGSAGNLTTNRRKQLTGGPGAAAVRGRPDPTPPPPPPPPTSPGGSRRPPLPLPRLSRAVGCVCV